MKDEVPQNQPSIELVTICGGIALLIGLWWGTWLSNDPIAKLFYLLLTWGGDLALLSSLIEEFR